MQTGLEMLQARIAPERIVPDGNFQESCLRNDQVQIERDGDGLIQIYPLNTVAASEAGAEITAQLRRCSEEKNARMVLGSSAGFFLPDGSMFCPIASLISNTKCLRYPRMSSRASRNCVPVFVIELITGWKTRDLLLRNLPLWVENGVSLAWLINSGARSVTVYRQQAVPVIVTADWLAGDGPMGGLRFDLWKVWSCYEQGSA